MEEMLLLGLTISLLHRIVDSPLKEAMLGQISIK